MSTEKTTAVAKVEKPKALAKATGSGLSAEQIELVKNTVARGATNDELQLFLHVAKHTGLDPFTKQIHFVKRKVWNNDKKAYDEVGTIQTGIDGYRVAAARTGEHMGTDDAKFTDKNEKPVIASVTVYRCVKGEKVAFTGTAYWEEYAQINNKTNELMGLWKKMPRTMLAKCAESLALRKGFPDVLAGIYTNEEMTQADGEPTHTEDGNPKGTITQGQSAKIYAMIGENGWQKEKIDEWTTGLFGVRISGLSTEQAATVIDALEKKAAQPKPVEATVVTPPPAPDAAQKIIDTFGGEVVQEPAPAAPAPAQTAPAPAAAGIDYMAEAKACPDQETATAIYETAKGEGLSSLRLGAIRGQLASKGFTVS